jgi:hypothetical protein
MMPRKGELTAPQATDVARHFLGPIWHAYLSPIRECCLVSTEPYQRFYAHTWRAVFRAAGVKLPVRPQFIHHKERVMHGEKCVAIACSSTFARRTTNALNEYEPDSRGL